jgi:hypothetical protein
MASELSERRKEKLADDGFDAAPSADYDPFEDALTENLSGDLEEFHIDDAVETPEPAKDLDSILPSDPLEIQQAALAGLASANQLDPKTIHQALNKDVIDRAIGDLSKIDMSALEQISALAPEINPELINESRKLMGTKTGRYLAREAQKIQAPPPKVGGGKVAIRGKMPVMAVKPKHYPNDQHHEAVLITADRKMRKVELFSKSRKEDIQAALKGAYISTRLRHLECNEFAEYPCYVYYTPNPQAKPNRAAKRFANMDIRGPAVFAFEGIDLTPMKLEQLHNLSQI